MNAKLLSISSVQGALLCLILLLSPVAMTFGPYEGIYTQENWRDALRLDPLYLVRAFLISGAMIAGVLSTGLLVVDLVRNVNVVLQPDLGARLILQGSMAMCSLSVGWAAFPYWVNGVFQAYPGAAPVSYTFLYDPKNLIPMTWIGEVWRLGVLLIMIIVVSGGPILFLFNLALSFITRNWKKAVATTVCLLISAAVLFSSPNYLRWLAD